MISAARRTPIDRLLEDIRLIEGEYRDYRPPPTGEILATARASRAERASARVGHPGHGALAGRSEPEQARHELNLAATLVLHQRATAEQLDPVAARSDLDPEGALVLACLMQLAGRHLAARFWFKFAAGGGCSEAAYCLCLIHRAAAEFQDADHWRREAARLRRDAAPPVQDHRAATRAGAPPGLARELRSLLAQCYGGGNPRLPKALETTIDKLE